MNNFHSTVLTTASVTVCVVLFMPQILRSVFRLLPSQVTSIAGMASSSRALEEFSMAFVTAPNGDVAKQIAGGIVSNKLAACVNIIPGNSLMSTTL